MLSTNLISIIIPTYNRAHLIGETLNSILQQTYQNWECIVVDDGSCDGTKEVMKAYCQKDSRIQYHQRPKEHLPGGNGARNYGFKLSKGEYIQWFDSDDLMKSDHLEIKWRIIKKYKLDFVISRTANFVENKNKLISINKYQNNDANELNLSNFLNNRVYWLTCDILFYKKSLPPKLKFTEYLKSGQETNFFIKLLSCKNFKSRFIDVVLTHRRIHDDSIRNKVESSKNESFRQKCLTYIDAYFYIYEKTNQKNLLVIENIVVQAFQKFQR